ncbi:SMC-Scp complex subunit ScpB [Micromonospora sp. NPDC047670]|uniref:SMC-Scp complex subunit ScpB n=1 Tax=Micromonospora sp. NPDC047670 TaxID=3364252 RepID=UPI00371AA58A
MSSDERRDSLADQAAAWVPPWQRPTPPATTTPGAVSGTDSDAEAAPGTDAVADADTDTDTVADPDTDTVVEAALGAVEGGAGDLGGLSPPEGPKATKISEGPAAAGRVAAGPAVGDVPAGGVARVPAGEGAGGGVPEKASRARRRATQAPEPAPELDDAELRGALEAILLVVDEPVSELTLAQVLEQPAERIGPMLDEIAAGYTAAGHGFELRRAAGGWRLYTRPEYATYVERFVLDGQSVRLTQAALETLAVVAYKQPVTRSRISAIRGVNCDGVIRTLVSRGLVEECGAEPDSGAFLYRTTTMFLEKLGLNSVDDLPPLAPFLPDDVEELADATR